MTPFGLTENAVDLICIVMRRHPEVTCVAIYGSRAKGNYKPYSDIDLAVFGEIDFSLDLRLRSELDDLPLPYKFDVTPYQTLNHAGLKDHIDRVGKVIYSAQPVPSSPEEVSHVQI